MSSLNLLLQVMLHVALRKVIQNRAVLGKENRRDVNCLCVPNFAVFDAEFLSVACGQKTQFSAHAEVGDDQVHHFVQHSIVRRLLAQHFLWKARVLSVYCAWFRFGTLFKVSCVFQRLRPSACVQLIKTESVEVHDVSNIEAENPRVLVNLFHSQAGTLIDFVFVFVRKLVHFFERLKRNIQVLLFHYTVSEILTTFWCGHFLDWRERGNQII